MPCGSRSSAASIINGSAAVSDQTIASCWASRMFDPSEPVPSIRLPKNRNAIRNSGTASPIASHGISICDARISGTMPRPPTSQQRQPDDNLQQAGGAQAKELAGENLVGVRRRQQHFNDLVFLLGGRPLHEKAGRHQYRHQEQHREHHRHYDAYHARRLPASDNRRSC